MTPYIVTVNEETFLIDQTERPHWLGSQELLEKGQELLILFDKGKMAEYKKGLLGMNLASWNTCLVKGDDVLSRHNTVEEALIALRKIQVPAYMVILDEKKLYPEEILVEALDEIQFSICPF